MGFALAGACTDDAQVELISARTFDAPDRVTVHPVTSATEMCEQALALSAGADVFIGTAAVADYRPESASAEDQKGRWRPPDTHAGREPRHHRLRCTIAEPAFYGGGFAAETESLMDHAREKRQKKGLDMIIANDVSDPDTTFGSEQNAVHLITEDRTKPTLGQQTAAKQIVAAVAATLDR